MNIKSKFNNKYVFVERPNGIWYYYNNVDFYGWGLDEDDHKLTPLSNFLEILRDGNGGSDYICLDTVPRNGINEILHKEDTIDMTENFIIIKVLIF